MSIDHLRIAILIISFFCHSYNLRSQTIRIQPSCPINIIIAVDFSGSELAYMDQIHRVLKDLTGTFELDSMNLKIGIITFNRGAELVLPLTSDTQKMDQVIDALRLERLVYATDIHASIELAYREFSQNSPRGIPKYFVLISDGDPHAHERGFGFQADLRNIEMLKAGDPSNGIEPVHVFSLYTGGNSSFRYNFGADIIQASINHMKTLASDEQSFLKFEEYPRMISFFKMVSSCM